jgi:hypothetical protein
MHTETIDQPCHNFQILGIERFQDPLDGREKVVLANFAAGSTGTLVIVDPQTGEGESLELPGDSGAWALHNLSDQRLLIGTCGSYGYLHDLDLRTRRFAPPLRDPDETYIWNLCTGSDGMIYGGTYPGCVLLRFDPQKRELLNLGRVSDDPANLYSRLVYGGIPGHILITCGSAASHLALWSMETGTARRFGEPGDSLREIGSDFICLQRGTDLVFYDIISLAPLERDLSASLTPSDKASRFPGVSFSVGLANGSALGVCGQAYYVDDGGEATPELLPIPATAPATHMLTIAADSRGRVWGASGFGQTVCRFDPVGGDAWNSQVVTSSGGEVYGIVPVGDRIFLSCYSGGDHVVYDPSEPWNQLDNTNPRTLRSVSPELIRPAGKSVLGPDGNVWTGWTARYGIYGGGLSRVDPESLEVTSWYDPIPQQAVTGLTADEQYLYFVTSGQANGLATKTEPFHFVVWSADGQIVWQRRFAQGQALASVAAGCGVIAVAVDSSLEFFSARDQRFTCSVELESPCHYLAALWPDRLAAFCADHLWLVDPLTGSVEPGCPLPGRVSTATAAPDGTVYCAMGTELWRISR